MVVYSRICMVITGSRKQANTLAGRRELHIRDRQLHNEDAPLCAPDNLSIAWTYSHDMWSEIDAYDAHQRRIYLPLRPMICTDPWRQIQPACMLASLNAMTTDQDIRCHT